MFPCLCTIVDCTLPGLLILPWMNSSGQGFLNGYPLDEVLFEMTYAARSVVIARGYRHFSKIFAVLES
jgi:hypothetical protein